MNLTYSMLTGILASSLGALGSYLWEKYIHPKTEEHGVTLQDRLSALVKNLESATTSISEIEAEIAQRKELAASYEQDIKRYETVKDLTKDQVEAIAQTLAFPVKKESRRALWITTAVGFVTAGLFFMFGLLVGRH